MSINQCTAVSSNEIHSFDDIQQIIKVTQYSILWIEWWDIEKSRVWIGDDNSFDYFYVSNETARQLGEQS